jgi:hypothetical protein
MTQEDLKKWEEDSKEKKEADVAQKVASFVNSCKLQWSVTDDDSGLVAWMKESVLRNFEVG